MRKGWKIIIDKKARLKIEKHGLTVHQVKRALMGKVYIYKTYGRRYAVLGEDFGKIIKVIIEPLKQMKKLRVITAYEPSQKDKKLYKRKVKK